MSTIPRATYAASGDVEISFPYHARLVELLKAEIPAYARSYDPESNTWSVAAPYAAIAVNLLRGRFPDARIEGNHRRAESRPGAGAPSEHFALLHLLPSAPVELIGASYRVLARLHHPDVGGDAEHMKRLNAARDAMKALAAL